MLIVKVHKGNIDRAIKNMRRKVIKTKQLPKLREQRYFKKKSQRRREEIKAAEYKQNKYNEENQ